MQRRKFLTATAAATAFGATAHLAKAELRTAGPATKFFVVKAGASRFGEQTPFRGTNPNNLKVSGRDTGGALAIYEYVGKQKVGPSLHLHFAQDEIFYVVEGEYLFKVGDEEFTARPGDTIFGPCNVPHSWLQLTDAGKIVCQVQPAGTLEQFFSAVSHLQGHPTAAETQQLHQAHGMKVVGPPLALK
jgi:quercetin dioxygenase-like cupin family protein